MRGNSTLRRHRVLTRRSTVPAECLEYRLVMSAQSVEHSDGKENTAVESLETSNRLVTLTAGEFRMDSNGRLFALETNQPVSWKSIADTSAWPATSSVFDRPVAGQPVMIPFGMPVNGLPTANISFQGVLDSSSTGLQRQRLVSESPLLVKGGPANWGTLWDDLDSNIFDYWPTDRLLIAGRQDDGSLPAIYEFSMGPTTTVGDVLHIIYASYSGAGVELDKDGRIVLTAVSPGPSYLSASLLDAPTNTGRTDFEAIQLRLDQEGKFSDYHIQQVETSDAKGEAITIQFMITRLEKQRWQITAEIAPETGHVVGQIGGPIVFSDNGTFSHVASENGLAEILLRLNGQLELQRIQLTFEPSEYSDGLKELPGPMSLQLLPDGRPVGFLNDFDIDSHGEVNLLFSNGMIFSAGLVELNRTSGQLREPVYDSETNVGRPLRNVSETLETSQHLNDSVPSESHGYLFQPFVRHVHSLVAPLISSIASPTKTISPSTNSSTSFNIVERRYTRLGMPKAEVDDWRNTLALRLSSFSDAAAPDDLLQQESIVDADLDSLYWTLRIAPKPIVNVGPLNSHQEDEASGPVSNDSKNQMTPPDVNEAEIRAAETNGPSDAKLDDQTFGRK